MPGNDDQFKIIIDDSSLDKVIAKAKTTSAELVSQFTKASENLKAAFGKAFSADPFTSFATQIRSKVAELQGSVSLKVPVDIDVAKISTAAGTIRTLNSEINTLRSTAAAAGDAIMSHFQGAFQGISQQIQNLRMEKKILEDDLKASTAKGFKPLPTGSLRVDRLKQEEAEARSALKLLTDALTSVEHVQNALERAVTKVQQTPSLVTAVRKAVSKGASARAELDPYADETTMMLRDYAVKFHEQTGRLEDSISNSMENMASTVAQRIKDLPSPSSLTTRGARQQMAATKKEYEALLNDIVNLKSKQGTPHDILGAFEGPDLAGMLKKFLAGDTNVEAEIEKLKSRALKYKEKLNEFTITYQKLMEEVPPHLQVKGERVLIGTPAALKVPTTEAFFSQTDVTQFENRLKQLRKIKSLSEKELSEIRDLEAKIAFAKDKKSITVLPEVIAGTERDVPMRTAKHSTVGMGDPFKDVSEEIDHAMEATLGLDRIYGQAEQDAIAFAQGQEVIGHAIGQPIRQLKTLHESISAAHGPVDSFLRLLVGIPQSGEHLKSAAEMVRTVNSIAREPILRPGAETVEFAERLKGSVGNATGYVRRELAETTFKAQENLFKLGEIVKVMGEEVTRPFQKVIDHIMGVKDAAGSVVGLGPQFKIGATSPTGEKVPFLQNLEERVSKVQSLMMTLDTHPAETLPKLRKELTGLSTSLSSVGIHYKDINAQASEMSNSFRVQPLINDLRTLFTNPELSPHQLSEAQAVVGQLNSKFDQMVKYAPQLEPLRQQIKGVSDVFLQSKAFAAVEDPSVKALKAEANALQQKIEILRTQKPKEDYQHESNLDARQFGQTKLSRWQSNLDNLQRQYDEKIDKMSSKKLVPIDKAQVQAAYEQFATGIAPFANQLNFTQVISDALMGLARLSRGAGDVGRNASLMTDQVTKMIQLLHTASTKGLTESEGTELRKMASEMDRYTVKLTSDHVPVIRTLSKEYRSFHDNVDQVVGKMLKVTERGALPELIREKFAPPKPEQAMPLEDWIEKMAGGKRIVKQVGSEINKEWQEIFLPPGSAQGKKLTVADMFGTGRLELIDQVTAKTQSYGRAIDYVANRLGTPGEFETFYQPIMKSSEALKILINRLRETVTTSGALSPTMASMILSLDTAQTSLGHTTGSFNYLKNAMDRLRASGGTVTPQWISETQKGLEQITKVYSTGTPPSQPIVEGGPWTIKVGSLQENVSQYQDRLRGILSGTSMHSDPSAIYSSIKEAMKLPMAMGKEPIAAKGIGELLFGGGKDSLIKAIPFERVMQIKGALGEYVTEVVESGFGFKSIQRAQIAVGRLFKEIRREVNDRELEAFQTGKPLPSVDSSLMPSRWEQEGPKLAKHMKGAMKDIFGGIEEADPGTYPAMGKLIDRASNWSLQQLDDRMKTLKRKSAQLQRDYAAEAVPGELDMTASTQKMMIKGLNFDNAISALEKAKQNVITQIRKRATKAGPSVLTASAETLAEDVKAEDLTIIKEPVKDAKKAVTGSLDDMTKAKAEALNRQLSMMKGKGGEAASMLRGIETQAAEDLAGIAKTAGTGGLLAKIYGSGDGGDNAISRNMKNIISPFTMISNQLETFGMVLGKSGQPLSLMGEMARATRTEIMGLIKELSKAGVSTDYLDEHIAKFNSTAAEADKVHPFSELIRQLMILREQFREAIPEYLQFLEAGDTTSAGAQASREKMISYSKMMASVEGEINRSENALYQTGLLREDLARREVETIKQLGVAFQEARLQSEFGRGPLIAEGREALAQTSKAGRGVAVETLTAAAWKTQQDTGTKSPLFEKLNQPFATVDDLKNKLLSLPEQLTQISPQIGSVIENFRALNDYFNLGIKEPKGLDSIPARFDRIAEAQSKGIKLSPSWAKSFADSTTSAQGFIRQVMEELDKLSVNANQNQFARKYTEGIQAARDNIDNLILKAKHFADAIENIPKGQATRQLRISAVEEAGPIKEEIGSTLLAAQKDSDMPREKVEELEKVGVRLNSVTGNQLSLWERITNTVKTTRNNFADLFMYQVRWYSSMMIFWGVFNKVGETFKALVDTQHQVQRAVRAMREESGELVQHWERLEKVASARIFEGMIKWATDAKMAGEALWQLGSAGLTAQESLSALGPTLALIRSTEGDPQETTKILAGVYNTLGDSIEGAASSGAKFRIISDVMSKVFKDHQVEISELNQGYRFAISSADTAGLSFYELSAILGVLNDNMIKGSRAGRGLQQVLVHIAKEPYDIAASFIELAKHMGVAESVYAKLGNIKNMSTMELMREFSNIAKASGKSMEGLGRIMEEFGMIGGRTMAPLLLNFDKVDKSVKQLLLSSIGSSELMGERMATTVGANLRRVASYFQSSMYPVITATNSVLATIMSAVAHAATGLDKMQGSAMKGGFGAIGLPSAGAFTSTFVSSSMWLGTLAALTAQLGPRFDIVGKGLGAIGDKAHTVFSQWSLYLSGAANETPKLAAHIQKVTGAFTWLWSSMKMIITADFWSSLASGAVSAFKAIGTAAAAAYESYKTIGLLPTLMVGLRSAVAGVAAALGMLATAFNAHPILMAIALISAAAAGMVFVWRAWTRSYEDAAAEAIEANGKYMDSLGKLEQKSIQAFHAITSAANAKESFSSLTSGLKDTENASEDVKTAFNDWLRSLGISAYTADITGVSVGDLKDKVKELSTEIKSNEAALRGHFNAVLNSKELADNYTESLKKQIETLQLAEVEQRKSKGTGISWFDPNVKNEFKDINWTNAWRSATGIFRSDETLKAWETERMMMINAADENFALANKQLSEIFKSRATSIMVAPVSAMVEDWKKSGMTQKEMEKALELTLTPSKFLTDKTTWVPQIEKLDFNKIVQATFPDEEVLVKLKENPERLRLTVGASWAKAIEKLDLSNSVQMLKARQLATLGVIESGSGSFRDKILESLGIKFGPEALKKQEDALNRAMESVLKAKMSFDKEFNAYQITSGEARVAALESGFTPEKLATDSFNIEMKRLYDEQIETHQEFENKRAIVRRKHGDLLHRDFAQKEMLAVDIEEQRAQLKIQAEQFELAKKMGDIASKAYQGGSGEQLKHQYTLMNLQAREKEAQAAEKLARVEKEIGANVRANAQEAQAAHRLKMEAYRLEAEAKRKEYEYTMTTEKLKWESMKVNSQSEIDKSATEEDPKKKLTPAAVEFFKSQISTADRMMKHVGEMFSTQVAFSGMEEARKRREEETRHQDEQFKIQLHNLKVALQNGASSIAAFQKEHSQGIFGTSKNLTAPITGILTSTFYDNRPGRPQGHHGGDIAAPAGTPFFAPTDLTIQNTRQLMSDGKTGGMVWGIDEQGIWHKFHHVNPQVQSGQKVRQGEQLGVLSDMKGPHLDYKMQGPGGEYIDWMSQLGLGKGARIGKGAALPMTMKVKPELSIQGGEGTILDEFNGIVQMMKALLQKEGPKAQMKIKPTVTEFFNILKDMQLEPAQIERYKAFFDQLAELWRAAGLNMKHFYQLTLDPYKKMFEGGKVLDVPVLVRYTQAARAAGESDEQIRKRVFEADKIAFENEGNWTQGKFQSLMDFIGKGAVATGISGKKLFSSLFTEVFSPSKLQIMIDSDIDLMEMFYQQLAQLGRDLTGGGVPVKIMKSFETAIKGIINAGEELDDHKYKALVNTLAQIPSINLKEAADSVEKYWQSISNSRAFNVQDIGKMQNDMMRFGATQDEVWKAIGEVADVQIRRMYASWDKGAQGMKSDMSGLKELGEAFWWGMTKGVADFASKLKDPIRRLADEVTQVLTSMQSTLESVIGDTLKSDFKGWNEYLTKFGEQMINIASKNMSEMIMQSFTGLIGKALGLPGEKKPGTMTQEEAEAAGKGKGEQQSRFNIEQTKINTESIKSDAKRTADGIDKLVAQGEKTGKYGSEKASTEGTAPGSATSSASGEKQGGTGVGTMSPSIEAATQKKAATIPTITSSSTDPSRPGETYVTKKYTDKDGNINYSGEWVKNETPARSEVGYGLPGYVADETPKTKLEQTLTPTVAGEVASTDQGWFNNLLEWFREKPSDGMGFKTLEPLKFASGGVVPGSGDKDSVPAMLTPGEIIISRAMARRFAEGGEVENPLQGLMSGIGDMVQGMISPITKMMDPRARQIASIGEGNYGGTLEQQAGWEQQFEQQRNYYRQIDAQKYAQYQQKELQKDMQGGFFSTMLSGLLGGGKAEGGLIQKLNLGGLVQFLAGGGPILQKDINAALVQLHTAPNGQLAGNWQGPVTQKSEPWWKKMLPWLLVSSALAYAMFGGKGGDKKADADTAALKKKLDATGTPNLEGKDLEQAYKENLSGLPDQGMFAGLFPNKKDMFGIPTDLFRSVGKDFKSKGWMGDAGGKLNLDTGTFTPLTKDLGGATPASVLDSFEPEGYAAGGPVIQTRSASETPWQNMGHTQTVYTGGSTFWQALRPYLMLLLPMLVAAAQKKKSSGTPSDVLALQKKLTGMKDPNLSEKSIDQLYSEKLTSSTGQPGDLGTMYRNFLETGKTPDFAAEMKNIKLDSSVTDISDLQDKMSAIKSTPTESSGLTGILGNDNILSKAWGGLSSMGSSLWEGLSSVGSSLSSGIGSIGSTIGGWFGFADGGEVSGVGSGIGGFFGNLIGSIWGPIGGMIGKLAGSRAGGHLESVFNGGDIMKNALQFFVLEPSMDTLNPEGALSGENTMSGADEKTFKFPDDDNSPMGAMWNKTLGLGEDSKMFDTGGNILGGMFANLGKNTGQGQTDSFGGLGGFSKLFSSFGGSEGGGGFGDLFSSFGSMFAEGGVVDDFSKSISPMTESLASTFGSLASGIGSTGSSLISGIGSAAQPMVSSITDMVGSIGSGIGGIGSSLLSGIGSIFGLADGGFIDPSEILPQLSQNWESQLNSPDADIQRVALDARSGVGDVVDYFQKNNPAALSTISKVVGTSPTFSGETEGITRDAAHGGFYNPFTDKIALDLKEGYADPSRVRGDYASALTHEVAHDLSKTGRPLAGWLQQIDPAKVESYLKEQGITDPKELAYLQSPHETIARGVAHHVMQKIGTPGYESQITWPKEYDPMMQELAQGMATGKYPQAPDQGIIKNLLWKVWGKPAGFAAGGTIPGSGDGDTVPAMLTPGEFVVNKGTVGMFGPQFFHALQDLAKTSGASASPETVLAGAHSTLRFATGGVVPQLPKVSSATPENKITVATVMDEESVGQFLNTKKYGEVLVNKLGSGITRRMQGGQGL